MKWYYKNIELQKELKKEEYIKTINIKRYQSTEKDSKNNYLVQAFVEEHDGLNLVLQLA